MTAKTVTSVEKSSFFYYYPSIIESFLVEYHSFVKKTIHIEELETIIVYYIIIFCTLLAKLAVNKVELFANKITVALEMCLNIICLSQKEI